MGSNFSLSIFCKKCCFNGYKELDPSEEVMLPPGISKLNAFELEDNILLQDPVMKTVLENSDSGGYSMDDAAIGEYISKLQ